MRYIVNPVTLRLSAESGTETEDAISESLESRKEEKEEEEQEEKEEKEEKEEQEENTESESETESETAEGSDEAETTETDKDECVDTDDKCEDWAKQGECDGKFSEVMGKSCPKSCGLCSGKSKSETESKTDRACEDTDERCAEWKGNGECDGKFADFMVNGNSILLLPTNLLIVIISYARVHTFAIVISP